MMDLLDDRKTVQGHDSEPVQTWDYGVPATSTETRLQDPKHFMAWQIRHGKSDPIKLLQTRGHTTWDKDKGDEDAVRYHVLGMWASPVSSHSIGSRSSENLRVRLANANDYFRRKASEVYNDQGALDLLKAMDRDVVVDISDFDACSLGISLSKLTAASFCEIGAKVIFITDAGKRFIESLRTQGIN